MKKLIEKLKQVWDNIILHHVDQEHTLIKKIWYDEKSGQIFLHAKCRSGVFRLPILEGEKNSYWVANIFKTECEKKLPKTETIYHLKFIEDKH